MEQCSFVVSIDNMLSNDRQIPAGLPQVSVLSPTLYSIYISDITIPRNHEMAFYADDSAFICSGKVSNAIVKRMEDSLELALKYFDKWKIKVNNSKTQAIIFPYNRSLKRIPTRHVYSGGVLIPLGDSVKYLGVILDKKLSFKQHLEYICEKAVRCGKALYSLLNRRSKLNFKNKILLYKMCIRPIMTYACQVWFFKASRTYRKKLQVIQNKNLKIIHGLNPRYSTNLLHSNFGHVMIESFARELTLSFNEKCRTSTYGIIRNLLNVH